MVRHLPPDSATARVADRWWTEPLELATLQLELAHDQLRATLATAGAKNLPEALRIPRPYDMPTAEPVEEDMTLDDWRTFLEG